MNLSGARLVPLERRDHKELFDANFVMFGSFCGVSEPIVSEFCKNSKIVIFDLVPNNGGKTKPIEAKRARGDSK